MENLSANEVSRSGCPKCTSANYRTRIKELIITVVICLVGYAGFLIFGELGMKEIAQSPGTYSYYNPPPSFLIGTGFKAASTLSGFIAAYFLYQVMVGKKKCLNCGSIFKQS